MSVGIAYAIVFVGFVVTTTMLLITTLTMLLITTLRHQSFYGRRLWKPFRRCFFGQHDTYILRHLTETHEKVQCARCHKVFMVNSTSGITISWDGALEQIELDMDKIDQVRRELQNMLVPLPIREAAEILSQQGFD